MSFSSADPFNGAVPTTVPLPQTPLTGVLAQVRFPQVLSIAKEDYVAVFQEKIRSAYPLSQLEHGFTLNVTNEGAKQTTSPNYRFFDAGRRWRVSLTTGFVAVETRDYLSREDFTHRVVSVVEALSDTINPAYLTRIGVRYVDRLHGEHLDNLDRYVRPEVLGIYTHRRRHSIDRTITEVVAGTDTGSLASRWGFMPANQTHEPDLMPPIPNPSWFLDVDVYKEYEEPCTFDAQHIEEHVKGLAKRAYAFFRWVASYDLLLACGATND